MQESLGPKGEVLEKKLKHFNEANQAVMNVSSASGGNQGQNQASSGTARGGNPGSRTLCNPVFVPPDAPTDYLRSVEPATTSPLQEFENTHEFLH